MFAAVLVCAAFRLYRRGITADAHGMVVRNLFTTRQVPWNKLGSVDHDAVENEAGGITYHRLAFTIVDGRRFVSETPGGSPEPGGFLSNVRDQLVAMRDAAVEAEGLAPLTRPAHSRAQSPAVAEEPTHGNAGVHARPHASRRASNFLGGWSRRTKFVIGGIALGVAGLAGVFAVDGIAGEWRDATVISVESDDGCTFEWAGGQDWDYCPAETQVGDNLSVWIAWSGSGYVARPGLVTGPVAFVCLLVGSVLVVSGARQAQRDAPPGPAASHVGMHGPDDELNGAVGDDPAHDALQHGKPDDEPVDNGPAPEPRPRNKQLARATLVAAAAITVGFAVVIVVNRSTVAGLDRHASDYDAVRLDLEDALYFAGFGFFICAVVLLVQWHRRGRQASAPPVIPPLGFLVGMGVTGWFLGRQEEGPGNHYAIFFAVGGVCIVWVACLLLLRQEPAEQTEDGQQDT